MQAYELTNEKVLAMVIDTIEESGLGCPKADGSEKLAKFSKAEPSPNLNIIEFCATFEAIYFELSDGCGENIVRFFKDDKVTVKEFAEMLSRAIMDIPKVKKRFLGSDDGQDCPHYEKNPKVDNLMNICDCLGCKHWEPKSSGELNDTTIGECNWRWKDANGEAQTTFF